MNTTPTTEVIKNDRILTITSQFTLDQLIKLAHTSVHHATRHHILRTAAKELLAQLAVSYTPLEFNATVTALQYIVTTRDWDGTSLATALIKVAPAVHEKMLQAHVTGFPPSVSVMHKPVECTATASQYARWLEAFKASKTKPGVRGELLAEADKTGLWKASGIPNWADFLRSLGCVGMLYNLHALGRFILACKAAGATHLPRSVFQGDVVKLLAPAYRAKAWLSACAQMDGGYPTNDVLNAAVEQLFKNDPDSRNPISIRRGKRMNAKAAAFQPTVVEQPNLFEAADEVRAVFNTAGLPATVKKQLTRLLEQAENLVAKAQTEALHREVEETEAKLQELRSRLQRVQMTA